MPVVVILSPSVAGALPKKAAITIAAATASSTTTARATTAVLQLPKLWRKGVKVASLGFSPVRDFALDIHDADLALLREATPLWNARASRRSRV